MLDAYTVRKAVPRILLAVIGINLSIYLCIAAIDITNVIGRGIGGLITEPFLQPDSFKDIGVESNVSNNIAFGGLVVASLIGGGALFAPGIAAGAGLAVLGVLIPFAITIALITLAILFTLIIRQGLLIFLTIISPVAIALFVLPGTEKYFKSWADLFIKTLLVYPIIASIFAISTALAAILLGTAGDSPGGIGLAKILGTIIVVFAPLVLIPFAFKLAGGAISAVMNAGSSRSANLAGNTGKRYQQARQNPNGFLGGFERNVRKNAIDRKSNLYSAGVRQTGVRGAAKRLIAGRYITARQADENKESSERIAAINATGNDDFARAATLDMDKLRGDSRRYRINKETNEEEFMAPTGRWYGASTIQAGKNQFKTAGDLGAAHRLVMAKTENVPPENQQMVLDDFLNYANSSNMDAGLAAGTWAGVAIPNLRLRADLRYTGISKDGNRLVGKRDHGSLVDFVATNQGYSLASQGEGTFEALAESYKAQAAEYQQVSTLVASATEGSAEKLQLETRRNQIRDRLSNARGNLEKFVADPTQNMSPEQREAFRQAQEAQGTGQEGVASPYGASSSASFKVAQAASKALEEIREFDKGRGNGGTLTTRDYSGGNQGDR